MTTFLKFSVFAALLTGIAFVAGCDVPRDVPKPMPSESPLTPKEGATDAKKETSDAKPETQEAESALAGLSAEDRALVDAQKLCPVTGEKLGSAGPPVKMTVKGEVIFLCCQECKPKVEADPDKYLAKVDDLKKGKSTPEGAMP